MDHCYLEEKIKAAKRNLNYNIILVTLDDNDASTNLLTDSEEEQTILKESLGLSKGTQSEKQYHKQYDAPAPYTQNKAHQKVPLNFFYRHLNLLWEKANPRRLCLTNQYGGRLQRCSWFHSNLTYLHSWEIFRHT